MKTIPLTPERQAELEEFARRRGKTPADALDEALATYLEWEKQDFEGAVRGIQQGYDDVKAGRTRPADQFLSDIRQKQERLILKCVSSSTDGNLIFIAYCSPSKPTPYKSCISATVDENLSHQPNKMERARS